MFGHCSTSQSYSDPIHKLLLMHAESIDFLKDVFLGLFVNPLEYDHFSCSKELPLTRCHSLVRPFTTEVEILDHDFVVPKH